MHLHPQDSTGLDIISRSILSQRQILPAGMSTSAQNSPSSAASQASSSHVSFPSHHYTEKVLNLADIKYEESYMRTPMPDLKWAWNQDPQHASSVVEKWDLGGEEVIESIECNDESYRMVREEKRRGVWGDGKREWNGYEEMNQGKKRSREYDEGDGDECIHSTPSHKKPKTRQPTH
jgi:hypothetical protein